LPNEVHRRIVFVQIMDLMEMGDSFTEYYAMDVVLMGRDGPGHIGIAQNKLKVRPLSVYHGKAGAWHEETRAECLARRDDAHDVAESSGALASRARVGSTRRASTVQLAVQG
jgi:hypothetical protein